MSNNCALHILYSYDFTSRSLHTCFQNAFVAFASASAASSSARSAATLREKVYESWWWVGAIKASSRVMHIDGFEAR